MSKLSPASMVPAYPVVFLPTACVCRASACWPGAFLQRHGRRVRTLPAIRIGETLENALMRLAAQEDHTLSGYVVRVLEKPVFGHASSLDAGADGGNSGDALQRSTTGYGELSDR